MKTQLSHVKFVNYSLILYRPIMFSFKKKKAPVDHSASKHLDIIKGIWYRKYDLMGIERYIALILCIVKFLFPTFWIRHFTRNKRYGDRNRGIEIYLIVKLLTLLTILWTQAFNVFTISLTIYFLLDIVQYLLWLIFLSAVYTKLPSIRRNFSHLCINIMDIVLSFAILYLYTSSLVYHGDLVHNSFLGVFYSFATFALVGDNEILPATIFARKLAFTQISISFLFIVIVISSFVSSLDIKNDD